MVSACCTDQFIFLTKANLGYGNALNGIRDYPFFRNYYAGGIDTVRGYQGYTLGPRDSKGKAFGGNMLADASVGLIFPNYISDNLRTSFFVDGGNVYSSQDNRAYGGLSTNSGPIRYSVGIEADWLTPFGPIELSLAKPINRHDGHSDIRVMIRNRSSLLWVRISDKHGTCLRLLNQKFWQLNKLVV